MKRNTKQTLLALLVMSTGIHHVMAAPISLNITGNVIASPCVVNNNNSDLNVDLGQSIPAATLAAAGSGSTPIPFSLALTACPTGTSNVTVSFTGTPDTTTQTMYKSTGTASNTAVELSQQGTGTILGNASTLTQPVQSDKSVTYLLSARAYSATGSVMPGNISSVVQASFTYN